MHAALARLDATDDPDLAWLAERVRLWLAGAPWESTLGLPPTWRTDLRRDERDALIRQARAFSGASTDTQDATRLARALRRYVETLWQVDQPLPPAAAGELRHTLHRIVTLNGGRPLSERQIYNVLLGQRGGLPCKSPRGNLHAAHADCDAMPYIESVTE